MCRAYVQITGGDDKRQSSVESGESERGGRVVSGKSEEGQRSVRRERKERKEGGSTLSSLSLVIWMLDGWMGTGT